MTISDNYVPISSPGNGVTTDFSFPWRILTGDYLVVLLEEIATGIQTPQTEGVHYSLTFNESGGVVSMFTPPPATHNLIRARDVTLDQSNPYKTSQGFQGDVLEDSLDKLTAMVQDLEDDIDRAIKFPVGSGISGVTFPLPAPGKGILWNTAGDGFENSVDDFNDIVTDAQAAQAAAELAQGLAETAQTAAELAQSLAETAQAAAEAAEAAAAGHAASAAASAAAAAASAATGLYGDVVSKNFGDICRAPALCRYRSCLRREPFTAWTLPEVT